MAATRFWINVNHMLQQESNRIHGTVVALFSKSGLLVAKLVLLFARGLFAVWFEVYSSLKITNNQYSTIQSLEDAMVLTALSSISLNRR